MPLGTSEPCHKHPISKFQYQKYPWGLSTQTIVRWKMHCAFWHRVLLTRQQRPVVCTGMIGIWVQVIRSKLNHERKRCLRTRPRPSFCSAGGTWSWNFRTRPQCRGLVPQYFNGLACGHRTTFAPVNSKVGCLGLVSFEFFCVLQWANHVQQILKMTTWTCLCFLHNLICQPIHVGMWSLDQAPTTTEVRVWAWKLSRTTVPPTGGSLVLKF